MKRRISGRWMVACAGLALLGALRADPVDLAGADLRVEAAGNLAADGYVNTADAVATLTLAFDDDAAALPSLSGAIRLVKLGVGTVTFPAARAYTGGTVVSNGFLAAAEPAWLGAEDGAITLAGGGLSFGRTTGEAIKLLRAVTVAAGTTGTLRNAAGGDQLDFGNSYVSFKDATLRLARAGDETKTAAFNIVRKDSSSWQGNGLATGGTLDVGPGTTLGVWEGDVFGGANHQTDITLVVREGASVNAGGNHTPLTPHVVLEGGSRLLTDGGLRGGGETTAGVENLIRTVSWKNYDFNRTVTVVLGSLTGASTATVEAANVHLAPFSQEAVIDVEAGAVLDVRASLWPAQNQTNRSLRKRGAGTLRLCRPLNIGGALAVEAGALQLAEGTSLGAVAAVTVSPGARVELTDGTALSLPPGPVSPGGFLATADVWFDASRLMGYTDGAAVSSVPNLGAAGGTFGAFPRSDVRRPTYAAAALNGRPALYFPGGSGGGGLFLDAYTNHTDRITLYLAMKWDGWTDNDEGAFCHWHGPLSLGPATWTAATEDYGVHGVTYVQWDATFDSVGFRHSDGITQTFPRFDGTPPTQTPILLGFSRAGTEHAACSWWTDTFPAFRRVVDTAERPAYTIDCIGLGTRLAYEADAASGTARVKPNANRALRGWIGELLVFSRTLSEEERAYVERYLQRKWGASAQEAVAAPAVAATPEATAAVSVPEGATAALVAQGDAGGDGPSARRLVKDGAGTLALAGEVDAYAAVCAAAGAVKPRAARGAASVAAIWLDADDAATVVADAEGRVVRVANKGSKGGFFAQNPHQAADAPSLCPTPRQGTLGERAALAFDGDAALALVDAAPATTNRRAVCLFAVCVRDGFEATEGKGYWGCPFALYDTSRATFDDGNGYHWEELGETYKLYNAGGAGHGWDSPYRCADGAPYVFGHWEELNMGLFGADYALPDGTLTNDVRSASGSNKPLLYDLVQLGGRCREGGVPQWYGQGSAGNRMWRGRIGELIVFDRSPARDQVAEIAAYLRKKWLGLGAGSATPPACLTGGGAADPGTAAAWEVAAGATLACDGAPLALGDVTLQDGAALARTDVADAGTFRLFDAASLSLGGAVSVYAPSFPSGDVTLLTAASVSGTPTWSLAGDGAGARKVTRRGTAFVITAPSLYLLIR